MTLVVLVTTAGFRSNAGVLIVPLHEEFGWSRGTIASAASLGLLMFGLSAPFAAALHDKLGMRKVIMGALATIAVASLLSTQITEPWQLVLLWGVVDRVGHRGGLGAARGDRRHPLVRAPARPGHRA